MKHKLYAHNIWAMRIDGAAVFVGVLAYVICFPAVVIYRNMVAYRGFNAIDIFVYLLIGGAWGIIQYFADRIAISNLKNIVPYNPYIAAKICAKYPQLTEVCKSMNPKLDDKMIEAELKDDKIQKSTLDFKGRK